MMKLKDLLKEAFAWERNSDGSLPTLEDATETHSKNLQEQENLDLVSKNKSIGSEKRAIEIYKLFLRLICILRYLLEHLQKCKSASKTITTRR